MFWFIRKPTIQGMSSLTLSCILEAGFRVSGVGFRGSKAPQNSRVSFTQSNLYTLLKS